MKFNYFFNSLYLLTNKTQMKMKKTQSLKLMLLGLMASVSTSALAAVGDVFDYGSGAGSYLFYEELADGNAKVIGIKSIGTAGTIIIPTTCENSWTGGTSLNVVAVDDDWAGKTKVVLTHYDVNGNVIGTPVEKETFDLNDLANPITLQIDAAGLTTIGTDALFTLNPWIKKFVVSAGAGLANIPDYAFINGKKTIDTDAEAIGDKQAEIAELQDIINGNKKVIVNGKIGDKQVYEGIQATGTPSNWVGHVFILGDEVVGNDIDKQPVGSPLYDVYEVQSDGSLHKTSVQARPRNSNPDQLVNYSVFGQGEAYYIAVKYTRTYGKYPALTKTKQNAETALQTAQTNLLAYEQNTEKGLKDARDAAKAAYDAAVAMQQKMQDPTVATAWNRATTNVWTAIGNGSSTGLTNVAPSYDLDTYNTIYAALVAVKWPVNEGGKFVLTSNDILSLNDAVVTKYNDYDTKEKALQTSLTTVKKPLQDALTKAENDFNAAKKALDDATAALNTAQGQLDTLNEGAPVYTVEGENTVLKNVEWNNEQIKVFGVSAFESCVDADFDNKVKNDKTSLPATTEVVKAKAFKNTGIDAGLYYANANIKEIGDEAFANTNTQYVNLANAVNLKNESIGKDAWLNCPVISILLQNTQLTQMPDGLAERIQRTDVVTNCDGEYIGKYVGGKLTSYKENEVDLTDPEDVAEKLYLANNTLTTVVMPNGATDIRAFNFAFCKKLNSITIPAGVKTIGAYALAGTAVTEFNLTALKDLESLGDGAFAYNAELQAVRFAPEAPFKSIEGESFACDNTLTTIVLNDDVECLAEGLFADSKVGVLDLSKTKIKVLRNLFKATKTDPNTTLTDIILPDLTYEKDATGAYVLDENGEYKVKTPGVQIIMDGALSYLHNLVGHALTADDLAALDQLTAEQKALPAVFIPSSVIVMRPNVFYGDQSLQSVIALNSKLTNLGNNTFANCPSLKVFVFITDQPIQPQWTVAPFEWMRPRPDVQPLPQPTPGDGDDDDDDDDDEILPFDDCGDESWATFSPDWFNFKDEQFALLDGSRNRVEVYVTEESYYSIKGDQWNSAEQNYSHLNKWQFVMTLTQYPDGKYYKSFVDFNFGTWIPMDQAKVYTAYQDGNEIYAYGAKHNGTFYKIPAAGPSTYIEYDEETGEFDRSKAIGSAAVIIRSTTPTITYKRVSLPGDKVQSGLDMLNELRVIKKDVKIYDEDNIWWFNFKNSTSEYGFFQIKGDIKAGRVVFPTADWQGMGYPSRINVTFIDDELTGIMGVKEYLETLKNKGAIYNLQGVKVSAPVKGQMYIQNGKKFIQK